MAQAYTGRKSTNSQLGFTLIELLTTIAIVGVLAQTTMSSFSLYKTYTYQMIVDITIANLRMAAEASRIDAVDNEDLDQENIAIFWPWGDSIGGVEGHAGYSVNDVLPGFRKNMDVAIVYIKGKGETSEYAAYVRHCKLSTYTASMDVMGTQLTFTEEDSGFMPCG
jgi:prepilin-type N-terminal cleavage/methylation domain-containing protein